VSTAIGRAALILTTNAAGLRSGLDGAGRDAMRWADNTKSQINSKLKDAGKDVGKGGLLAAAAGRVGGATAAAIAGVVGVTEAVRTLGDVARSGDIAGGFGLTAEQFTGMAGVAETVGEGTREFMESLVTLGKVSKEGAEGKGEVAAGWFKTLNLDAKQFNALPLEEKFFGVFEAIKKVQDPAERVRALMVAFGEDGGKYLLPLLAKAPEELRSMAKGFAISTEEVEKAKAAQLQLNAAGNTLKTGWRTIVIALAPAIGTVGKIISGLRPAFEWMGRAIEAVSDIAGPVFEEIAAWIKGMANEVGAWATAFFGLGEQTWTVKDVLLAVFRAVGTAGALAWDTIKAGVGAVLIGLGMFVSGVSYVTDAFSALVDLAKELPDAIKPSWVDEFADGVSRTSKLVGDTGKVLRNWGNEAVSGWGQSADKFNAFVDRIGNKTKEQAKAAAAEAVAAANQVKDAVLTKFDNAALLRGSAAEVNMRVRTDFKAQTAQEKLLAAQNKGNEHLKDIKGDIKKIAAKKVDPFEPF
jgi:hypothetical protein